jgi:hypothetical protein
MQVFRFKINWILPGVDESSGQPKIIHRQALAFRMAATDQATATHAATRIWTAWMRANPGDASELVTSWPRPVELGGTTVEEYREAWDERLV